MNLQLLLKKEEERQLLLAIKNSKEEIINKKDNKEIINDKEKINKNSFKIRKEVNNFTKLNNEEQINKPNINSKSDEDNNNKSTNELLKEEFDEEYGICPITLKYMENPVLTRSGFYYEKDAILDWLKKHDTDPISRDYLDASMLIEDEEYKKNIQKYRKKFNK